MWQICQNLLTKKVEVWLLFVNLPTCTHPSVAQAGPSWFWSDPVHWYNNHLTPTPIYYQILLQPITYTVINYNYQESTTKPSTDMTAIHKSNIYHNRLKPNNHTPSTVQPEDRESQEPL